ncbi:MAG: hypothetical protein J2P27_17250, partial [Actinobacteria bacterium]|nr:hypothetical protein [Actinomycetota bacterium]
GIPPDLAARRQKEALKLLLSLAEAGHIGSGLQRGRAAITRARRSVGDRLHAPDRRTAGDAVRALLALGIALALFLPAFFGDDSFNFMSQKEVDVVTAFFDSAQPGRVYSPDDDAPLGDTSRYELFPRILLFGTYGMLPKGPLQPDVATTIARDAWRKSRSSAHAYLMITPSMVAYNEQYEVTPARNFGTLRSSFDNSPFWQVLYDRDGIVIYQLLPRTQ